MMIDLNLSVDCNGKADHPDGQQSPVTSVSSVVDGGGETSSSNDDACSTRSAAAVALNFDIISGGGGDDPIDRDRGLTPAEAGLVTRELFPASGLGELNLGKQINDPVSLRFDHGPTRIPVHQPQQQVQQVQARKSRRGPRSRSSQYRGVTFYRRTGRWESHIWDCGKQVYLGGFDTALAAARGYDRAAIKFRGVEADINFNLSDYEEDMKQTKNMSKEEFVQILRRQSTGFSKCNKANASLDLNLGISTSSPKRIGNLGGFQFHPYDVQNANMFKERAGKGRTRLGSTSEEVVKWAWRMHDQVRATPITAASSGFSSPVFSNSPPYPTALNLCFSPNPTNISHYYSQIRSWSPRR